MKLKQILASLRPMAWLGLIGLALILGPMLPVDLRPERLPVPDLLTMLIFATLIRAPQVMPFWLVIALLLLRDMLNLYPLGLWALIGVIATEYIRLRRDDIARMGLLKEWLAIAGIYVFAMLLNQFTLLLLLAPLRDLGSLAVYTALSLLSYPLVVALIWVFPRIRKPAAHEIGREGEAW